MKKIIVLFCIVGLCVSASFAQIAFGVRGSVGASILKISNSEKHALGSYVASVLYAETGETASYSVDNEAMVTGGFALFGNYSLPQLPALGIQAELGFLFNNGTTVTVESNSKGYVMEVTDDLSYTTMELPLLITYTVNKGGFFEFIPQAGLYLSIPIGKAKQEVKAELAYAGLTAKNSETEKDKIDSACIAGFTIGSDFAFNFSQTSALLLNLRYMWDFNELKIDGDAVARRSVFLISAGYRYTIK